MDINNLTDQQKEELLQKLNDDKQKKENDRRESYEAIRAQVVHKIQEKTESVASDVVSLFNFVKDETSAFYDIMKEYGHLTREGQMNYRFGEGNFRIEVKTNKIKKFDERAEIAAKRLMTFLEGWIQNSRQGADDPMYQLAMNMLERNQAGDFDYKSISRLYELETKFNSLEYSDIMTLFKESNKVEGTATNFYFYKRDDRNVWRKIEINFNRL